MAGTAAVCASEARDGLQPGPYSAGDSALQPLSGKGEDGLLKAGEGKQPVYMPSPGGLFSFHDLEVALHPFEAALAQSRAGVGVVALAEGYPSQAANAGLQVIIQPEHQGVYSALHPEDLFEGNYLYPALQGANTKPISRQDFSRSSSNGDLG